MINIQIRGPLAILQVHGLTEDDSNYLRRNNFCFSKHLLNTNHSSELNKFTELHFRQYPIHSEETSVQITSFENGNYYDEGHTFLRLNVNKLKLDPLHTELAVNQKSFNYFIFTIQYGFGTALETDIMESDYKNFDLKSFTAGTILVPGVNQKMMHHIKLNSFPLENLNRKKYSINLTKSYIYRISSGKSITNDSFFNNKEIVHSDSYPTLHD